jgi:hypothetical protein
VVRSRCPHPPRVRGSKPRAPAFRPPTRSAWSVPRRTGRRRSLSAGRHGPVDEPQGAPLVAPNRLPMPRLGASLAPETVRRGKRVLSLASPVAAIPPGCRPDAVPIEGGRGCPSSKGAGASARGTEPRGWRGYDWTDRYPAIAAAAAELRARSFTHGRPGGGLRR